MTLNLSLSTESIESAIRQLQSMGEDLEDDVEQLVDILVTEGAEIAQSAYGEWDVQVVHDADNGTGTIMVAGDYPMIAEFGAGDATLSDGFENTPAEARRGSYSEQHAQQYSKHGYWFFGGEKYTEVEPRAGMRIAKDYIVNNYDSIAQEVIQFD